MASTDRFEEALSDGQKDGDFRVRKLGFGPFANDEMPTLFLMDAEYDPVFVQFEDDGHVHIFGVNAEWVSLEGRQLTLIQNARETVCGGEAEIN